MTQAKPISDNNRLLLSSLLEQTATAVAQLGTEFDLSRSTYHRGGIGVFEASPGKGIATFFRYEQN